MVEYFEQLKWNAFVGPLIWLLLGIVMIVWPDSFTKAVCLIIGIFFIIQGIIYIITYLRQKERNFFSPLRFVAGIVIGAMGIWVISRPDMVKLVIPIILSAVLLIHGVIDFTFTFRMVRSGYKKWWIALIFSLLTIGAGLFIWFHPAFVADFMLILIGIGLIIDGVSDLWMLWILGRFEKKLDSIVEPDVAEEKEIDLSDLSESSEEPEEKKNL